MSVFGNISQHLQEIGYNTLKGSKSCLDWCDAFGRQWIKSTDKNVVTWNIKISQGKFDPCRFTIGLVRNECSCYGHGIEPSCYGSGYYYFVPYNKGIFYHTDTGKSTDTIDKLHRKVVAGDTINLIWNTGSTTLSYYLNDEKSNIKVLTKSIKTGANIKYAFVLSMIPAYVSSSITVTQKHTLYLLQS